MFSFWPISGRQKKYWFFLLGLFLSLLLLKSSLAKEDFFLFNELLIEGIDGEEFIELYNPLDKDIFLENHYLAYYSSSRDWNKPYRNKKFPSDAKIGPRSFYLIAIKKDEWEKSDPEWNLGYSTHQLSDENGSLVIFPDNLFEKDNALVVISWGKVEYVKKDQSLSLPKKGHSLERTDSGTWQESFLAGGTPKEKNSQKIPTEESDDPKEEKEGLSEIILNEIYPGPDTKKGEKEFVEIKNPTEKNINLSGWHVEDGAKHKVYFPDVTAEANGLVFLEEEFQFNNTTPDLVTLFDPKGNIVHSLSYEKPKNGYSYSFDGTSWRWTKKVTKGKKNEFDALLEGKIKKDSKIYAGVYANFEVKDSKKTNKFTWDFGDGHKSYLKKTKHKYEKSGTYQASLRLRGDGEENTLFFPVKVSSFKKVDIEIKSLSPNPKGKDAKKEWIMLKNNTKKKVNLQNWSIATGTKKLTNHPIKKKFELKAGESKKLTHKECAFSLGNKMGKIELRYPNGKVADKLSYDKKGKLIGDDEIYEISKSKGQWLGGVQTKTAPPAPTAPETKKASLPASKITPQLPMPQNYLIELGKTTKNPVWKEKQQRQFSLLFVGSGLSADYFSKKIISKINPFSGEPLSNQSPQQNPATLSNFFWKQLNARITTFLNKS